MITGRYHLQLRRTRLSCWPHLHRLLTRISFVWLLSGITLFGAGCSEMNLMTPMLQHASLPANLTPFGKKKEKESFADDFELETDEDLEPPFLNEYVIVSGLNLVTLEGVGLVTGLDGTGGDPPPSQYRKRLLDDMRRRDIPNPNQIISSLSTALVVVRAYLPPLVAPGDTFDVEVRLPEGSETTDLNGGWLLECNLTERAIVAGKGVLEGKKRARAKGPILVSVDERGSNSLMRRGRVVGGGTSLESRDMVLFMRNDYKSVRNTTRVAARIGERFFSYDRYGHREALAEAKTDQRIVLKIHPIYKDNFPRFIQVIQNIAFRETDVERQVRIERLGQQIMVAEQAELAAARLEAIGPDGIPMLKQGLKADSLESRFHSAVALAYLGEPDGLEILAEAARDESAFRVFALAAMAVIDDGESYMLLRDLLSDPVVETRYGAFRGLTTIDDKDPFVRGELLNDQFRLHVLDIPGQPLIHLTHRQKAEIVLFGSQMEFKTPLAVTAGPHIMVNSTPGSNRIVVSRYRVGEPDQRKEVSARLEDVIRTAAEMGASYPDVAQMLVQAERQQNLPGPIGIDMLPLAGRIYERPVGENGSETTRRRKTKVGRENLAPNQFSNPNDEEEGTRPLLSPETETVEPAEESAKATAPEEKKPEEQEKEEDKKRDPIKFLKTLVTPSTSGEFLYPEQDE